MADLTLQPITKAGIVNTYAAADGAGDKILNNGRQFVHIKNGGVSPITVTLVSQVTNPSEGTAAANTAIVIADATEKMIGPFNPKAYNDAEGKVNLTYSAVTSVTIGAFSI